MTGNNHHTCSSCKHWDWYAVDYGEFPEDDCGSCNKTGEVMYGDDEACEDYCIAKNKVKMKEHNKQNSKKPIRKMRKKDYNSWD